MHWDNLSQCLTNWLKFTLQQSGLMVPTWHRYLLGYLGICRKWHMSSQKALKESYVAMFFVFTSGGPKTQYIAGYCLLYAKSTTARMDPDNTVGIHTAGWLTASYAYVESVPTLCLIHSSIQPWRTEGVESLWEVLWLTVATPCRERTRKSVIGGMCLLTYRSVEPTCESFSVSVVCQKYINVRLVQVFHQASFRNHR